ncbi:MAG TPA: response regulator [Gemmatimonadales bacterium]|nr:response regulator [Gemmatimonadales bacterium]
MSAAPLTVLIVEDEAPLRQVLERVLTKSGYRVLGAGSAETAYELLASQVADAVLLDVRLPAMSGLGLYLALVHRTPELSGRIAIMTGDADAEHVRAWLERNPCPVLKKPFDLQQILDWLRTVLHVPSRERGNA